MQQVGLNREYLASMRQESTAFTLTPIQFCSYEVEGCTIGIQYLYLSRFLHADDMASGPI